MITKGVSELIAEAEARSASIAVDEAKRLLNGPDTVFVDIRDIRELQREGMIPGAFHAPRGMLEFWVDPLSPNHKPVFAEEKTFILYCQTDRRGVLAAATLADMGMKNVFHLTGGFAAWRKACGPTVTPDDNR